MKICFFHFFFKCSWSSSDSLIRICVRPRILWYSYTVSMTQYWHKWSHKQFHPIIIRLREQGKQCCDLTGCWAAISTTLWLTRGLHFWRTACTGLLLAPAQQAETALLENISKQSNLGSSHTQWWILFINVFTYYFKTINCFHHIYLSKCSLRPRHVL